MAHVQPAKDGCFTTTYPNTTWQETPCTHAPDVPFPPARGGLRGDVVGNGTDASAKAPNLISEAVGSFDSVTGVTSESDVAGPDTYSLQLNANFFSSPACSGATDPSLCQGWQQFVYSNNSTGSHSASMQYWLLHYGSKCPDNWIPSPPDCYFNSKAVSLPMQPITNLANLTLTAQANAGGLDTLIMGVGGTLYSVSGQDNIVSLAQGWNEAEFNVFGFCCSTQAKFNAGATIVVRIGVNDGSPLAPSCDVNGWTGETNNLVFASPPSPTVGALPAIVFTETSIGSTAVSACASASGINGKTLAATHDFDGDGTSDVLWRDTTGNVGMWMMKGKTVKQTGTLGNVMAVWSPVGQRDFNDDAKTDVLWRDSAGNVGVWLMNGNQIVSSTALGNVASTWSVVGTGDFDGDGFADILWRDSAGNLAIWFMNGGSISRSTPVGNVPVNWVVAGSDMKGDIFWRSTTTGDVGMWVMNGATVAQTVNFGAVPLSWNVAAIGDFDGNGSADILWRDTGNNIGMWLLSGTKILSTGMLGTMPAGWSIAETGDFNADGKSDVLLIDTTGNVGAWMMNGTTISSTTIYGNVGTTWQVQSLNAN